MNRVALPPPHPVPRRAYPDAPLLAVAAILVRDGKVLLVQRGHPPAEGLWTLPGGGVETGESVRAALIREVREETGLSVTPGPLVEIFEVIEPDPAGRVKYHFVILDFLAQCPLAHQPCPASDAAALAWVEWDQLASYQTTAGLAPVLAKARKILADRTTPA